MSIPVLLTSAASCTMPITVTQTVRGPRSVSHEQSSVGQSRNGSVISLARRPNTGSAIPWGMCLTGNHTRCDVSNWDERGKAIWCPCDCDDHGSEWVPTAGPSVLALEIMERYFGPREPSKPRPHQM